MTDDEIEKFIKDYRMSMPEHILHLWARDALQVIAVLRNRLQHAENRLEQYQEAYEDAKIRLEW